MVELHHFLFEARLLGSKATTIYSPLGLLVNLTSGALVLVKYFWILHGRGRNFKTFMVKWIKLLSTNTKISHGQNGESKI